MRLKLFQGCLSLIATLILTDVTFGCSCFRVASSCQAFGSASAVFAGTVTGLRIAPQSQSGKPEVVNWMPRTFKFSVDVSFLGVAGTEVEVATGSGGGDCGYNFEMGQRYLVYAYRSTVDDSLITGICTRTRPYAAADEDLQFLGNLRSRSPGVTISGVVRFDQYSDNGTGAKSGAEPTSFLVAIEGDKGRQEIRTDEQGRYRLEGLSPGTYEVKILLPEDLITSQSSSKVTVADRGCAEVNFFVALNGRISGRVVDSVGQSVGKVLIALYEADNPNTEQWTKLEETNPDGSYNFSAVPPGRYFMVVGVTRYSQADDRTNAYQRTYYPGVSDVSQASVLSVGAGEKLIDRDLHLLSPRAARAVQVSVVWSDGTPVANAGLSFRDVRLWESGSNTGATADGLGRFTINAYEGQILVIEARSNRPYPNNLPRGQLMERTTPVRITVGNKTEQVKIVITKLH